MLTLNVCLPERALKINVCKSGTRVESFEAPLGHRAGQVSSDRELKQTNTKKVPTEVAQLEHKCSGSPALWRGTTKVR